MSAVELGVFTILGAGPLDSQTLGPRLGLAERGCGDFLDALVALGLLQRDASGCYRNTPEAARYLDRYKPTYIGGTLENLSAREYGLWSSLTDALKTGEPQTGFKEARHFGDLYSDLGRLERFVSGMAGQTLPVAQALATAFPWRNYGEVVDVGTAQGCLLVEIASAHSELRGYGFDLPQLQPLFERYVEHRGLSDRLKFQAGDFFTDPLPSAEVLVLGRVLHNWDMAGKKTLLRKAYETLPSGGAVVIYEKLIDEAREEKAAALLDSLNMLLMTTGGFGFSAAQCLEWMTEANFRDMRVEALAAGHSMIIGFK